MTLLGHLHESYIHGRRIRRLSELLSELIPSGCSLLDVGCGDGKISRLLLDKRPDLQIEGVDVLVRDQVWLPVKSFDGMRLPFAEASFDGVMLIDVLHHTDNPVSLLREAIRVSRRWFVVKDHLLRGAISALGLRFMDYVGNSRFGVPLPYNYLSPQQWCELRLQFDLKVTAEMTELGLYPSPIDCVFGKGLHFIGLWERNMREKVPGEPATHPALQSRPSGS